MNSAACPLTIYNNTNDTLTIRYLKGNGHLGNASVRIGPRGSTMLRDAYRGMKLYASNSFDPSSVYATLQVNADVDDVHFTENAGGYGRGSPTGPSMMPTASLDQRQSQQSTRAHAQRVEARRRKRAAAEAHLADTSTQSTPGMLRGAGGAHDDEHGTTLDRAHSSGLLNQDSGIGGGGDDAGSPGSDLIELPGLGLVERSSVPPHVWKQLEQRQAAQRAARIQEQMAARAPFPNYDMQSRAAALEGVELPPVRLASDRPRGFFSGAPLCRAEQFVSRRLHSTFHWPRARCDRWARPLFVVICLATLALVYRVWKSRSSASGVEDRRRRRRFL